jgi:hypothetical protein
LPSAVGNGATFTVRLPALSRVSPAVTAQISPHAVSLAFFSSGIDRTDEHYFYNMK